MNLARWIRRTPVPHCLVCGPQKIVIGEGHRRWADAVDAVFSCSSETVVAQAKDGTILRTCQRADIDDAPGEAEPDGVTPLQREVAQIAQILSDAYSLAHVHALENSSRGFELLARMAEASYQRLASIEKAYANLLNAHAQMMLQGAPADGLDDMIGGIVKRSLGGDEKPKGNNGASAAPKKE